MLKGPIRRDMDTAIRAAAAILVGIAASDFAEQYGTYTAYALREYKADMAADVLKAMWGRDLHDQERVYLLREDHWPKLEGFALVNNPTGVL